VKKIAFTSQAQADVRRLDQPTAMRIFEVLRRFAQTGVGDVKALKGESGECAIRYVSSISISGDPVSGE
jgi:hypothetical protein